MSTTARPKKLVELLRSTPTRAAAAPAPAAIAPTPKAPPMPIAPKATAPEKPATIAQLRAEFADDPDFVVDAYEQRLTMSAAWSGYTARLRQVRDSLRARAAVAQAQQAYPAAVEQVMRTRGLSRSAAVEVVNREQPALRAAYVDRTTAPGAKPLSPYEVEVKRVKADRKCSMSEAVDIVNRTRPDLRQQYLGRAT